MSEAAPVPAFLAFGDLGVDALATVEHLPASDEKLWIQAYRELAGGMMGNAAACVATLGVTAGVVALLGDDARGDFVLAELAAKDVDTRFVRRIAAPTFWALSLTTPQGDRALLQFPTPAFSADWEGFDRSALPATRWVHTSADQGEHVGPLFVQAGAAGITRSLDVEFPYVEREDLTALLACTDVAFLNERAVDHLGGLAEAPARVHAAGCPTVLVTLGSDGCLLAERDRPSVRLPAHRVQPVDTNGAGDVFAGAFAVACLDGMEHAEGAAFANMVAALSTTAKGGQGLDTDRARLVTAARAAGYSWAERIP